jgi:hypothetical protein
MAAEEDTQGLLVGIFLIPFFTGILNYQFLSNEYYDEKRHDLLESHERCQDAPYRCAEIADLWRDKKTGEIFSPDDFAAHKRGEAIRIAIVSFAYGLIGCFAFGYFNRRESEHAFFKYLGMAVCVNTAVAVLFFLAGLT